MAYREQLSIQQRDSALFERSQSQSDADEATVQQPKRVELLIFYTFVNIF